MSKTTKGIVYTIVLLAYGFIMVSLIANFFSALILAPILALGWATVVLISFIKNLGTFRKDLKEDEAKDWHGNQASDDAAAVIHEVEPHDIEWKFETIALIGFTVLYLAMLVTGLMWR